MLQKNPSSCINLSKKNNAYRCRKRERLLVRWVSLWAYLSFAGYHFFLCTLYCRFAAKGVICLAERLILLPGSDILIRLLILLFIPYLIWIFAKPSRNYYDWGKSPEDWAGPMPKKIFLNVITIIVVAFRFDINFYRTCFFCRFVSFFLLVVIVVLRFVFFSFIFTSIKVLRLFFLIFFFVCTCKKKKSKPKQTKFENHCNGTIGLATFNI